VGANAERIANQRVWTTIAAVVTGVILLVLFLAPLRAELHLPVFPQDEGLLLVYPSQILRGGIPNHSFESVYGVTSLWVLAVAFKTFGHAIAVERDIGILYRLAITSSLAVLAWRHRGPIAALVAGVISIVLFVGTLGVAAFAWIAALAFCSVAFVGLDVALEREQGRGRLPAVFAGFAFGLAVGARLDISVGIILVIVALAVTSRSCLRWLTTGLLVGLVPLVVNVIQAGPAAVIRDQIVQPIFVSGPSRRLPLSTLSSQELALLALCCATALTSAVCGSVLVHRHAGPDADPGAVLLLVLGVFELAIIPQAVQRSDSAHLSLVGCFVLASAVLLPPIKVGLGQVPRLNILPLAVGLVVLVLARSSFGSVYWSEAPVGHSAPVENLVTNEGRSVPIAGARNASDLTALLYTIDTRAHAGQRVFVGPLDLRTANYNDTFIYFLLPQLIPGSYYLEMNPGVANAANSQLASDLRTDSYLILTDRYDSLADPDPSTRFGPNAPNLVVAREFHKVETSGPWVLYQHNGTPLHA
jgi:hypothetical protein